MNVESAGLFPLQAQVHDVQLYSTRFSVPFRFFFFFHSTSLFY